jgi:hypothetical protein
VEQRLVRAGVGAAVIPADINKPYATAADPKQMSSAVLHGVIGAPCLRLGKIDLRTRSRTSALAPRHRRSTWARRVW